MLGDTYPHLNKQELEITSVLLHSTLDDDELKLVHFLARTVDSERARAEAAEADAAQLRKRNAAIEQLTTEVELVLHTYHEPGCTMEELNEDIEKLEQAYYDMDTPPISVPLQEIMDLQVEVGQLRAVLEAVANAPSVVQEMMRRNGLKIDNLDEPMQKLAFSLYTDLVSLAAVAQAALDEKHAPKGDQRQAALGKEK